MPIPSIPGARTIENIIAALPTNVSQSIQIRNLGEQLAKAELVIVDQAKTIAELAAKLEDYQRVDGIAIDAVKILQLFFKSAHTLTAEIVTRKLGMDKSYVDHYFDVLGGSNFIEQSDISVNGVHIPHAITPEGRAFIVKNKLA